MIEIAPEFEQQLADMSPLEFAVLTARVRAPDLDEQFIEIAKSVVPEHVIERLIRFVNVSAFVDATGHLDEQRIRKNLQILFGPLDGEV